MPDPTALGGALGRTTVPSKLVQIWNIAVPALVSAGQFRRLSDILWTFLGLIDEGDAAPAAPSM